MRSFFLTLALGSSLVLANVSQAQRVATDVPHTISFQALLSEEGKASTGTKLVTVRLYSDAEGTEAVWSDAFETKLVDGLVNLQLGSQKALPVAAFDQQLYVGVQIGTASEMRPLTKMSTVPYAMSVANGAVTAEKISADYVSAVTVDGKKISGRAAVLNFAAGDGLRMSYDEASNTIVLRAATAAGNAKGDGTLATTTIAGDLKVNGNTDLGGTASNPTIKFTGKASSNLNMNSNTLTNVRNPTGDQEAATKYYVDHFLDGVGGNPGWYLTGNTGLTTANYIGTADAVDLLFKTDAAERLRILSTGNIGIGTSTPAKALDVAGTFRATGASTFGSTVATQLSSGVVKSTGAGSNLSTGSVNLASEVTGILPVLNGGTGSSTESGARTALGLGSIATQASSSVDLTGGKINGTTIGATSASTGKFTDLVLTGTLTLPSGSILTNSLESNSVTVKAGTGLSGGGAVALGDEITLNNAGVTSITGTSNQIATTGSTGAITLSLPQSIATTSTPTFSALSLTNALTVGNGGTGASSASGARTNLGLGSMATQASDNVTITGGSITGLSDPTNNSDVATKNYVDNNSAIYTAGNGLTLTSKQFTLGGTLGANTTIATGGNNLFFTGLGKIAIGNNSPSAVLDVTGTASFSGNTSVGGTFASTGDLSVNSTKFTVAATSGNTAVAGTLASTGNFSVNSTKFTVAASSGNTAVAGTLGASGDFAVNTDKFTVAATSGNTVVGGTLASTGNLSVASTKFTVAAATGNTAIAGTLGTTGDFAVNTNKFTVAATTGNTSVAGTLGATGDLAVNTNKFTVTAASGNTSVGGTLGVTGKLTASGAANTIGSGADGAQLTIEGVVANGAELVVHGDAQLTGYLTTEGFQLTSDLAPVVDNVSSIGTETNRVSAVYSGPAGLIMAATSEEQGGTEINAEDPVNWKIGIHAGENGDVNNGKLVFLKDDEEVIRFDSGFQFEFPDPVWNVSNDIDAAGDVTVRGPNGLTTTELRVTDHPLGGRFAGKEVLVDVSGGSSALTNSFFYYPLDANSIIVVSTQKTEDSDPDATYVASIPEDGIDVDNGFFSVEVRRTDGATFGAGEGCSVHYIVVNAEAIP